MNSITISAVGDFMPGGLLSSDIVKYKNSFLSEEVRRSLNADIVFSNLECPLCNLEGPPHRLKTSIHAKEESIIYLKNAGFNIVSIANNHATDFGWSSLEKTIEILEENNIRHVGAGKNLEEARKPAIIDIKGVKIGFLAYCTGIFSRVPTVEEDIRYATENSYGVSPYDPHSINEDIENLKKYADYIVISMHWQDEFIHYPIPEVILEAHRIIDMGADLILGHGPHVLQGYEEYHDGLILYSLSNFLFSPWFVTNEGRWINYEGRGKIRGWHPESRKGVIFKCRIPGNKGKIDYTLIPTIQDRKEPIVRMAQLRNKDIILKKMGEWSQAYEDENYNKNYTKFKRKEEGFKLFKDARNELDTYGLISTIKKGGKRFLRF